LGRYRYVRFRWRLLFTVVDFLGSLLFGPLRALKTSPRRPDDPRTILLIQLDHLGDAILSTVLFPALRKRYPAAAIEVLTSPAGREVFLAVDQVDRVHVCRANRLARTGRLGWVFSTLWWGLRLRARRVDLGIDVPGEFPPAVILWFSGARRRLGWTSGGGGFLLTDSPRFVVDRPEVESRLALLGELGIRVEATAAGARPAFHPSHESRGRVAARLAEMCREGPPYGPRIVMHVGAGTRAKQWPVQHWRELVGRVVQGLGAQVILVGDGNDRTAARAILGREPWSGVTDWTGRLGLLELAALFDEADLFVGADSGPAHLAAAVRTPAVVLFSGTNTTRQWQPIGEAVRVLRHPVECSPCHRRRCPRHDHPCMRGLAPKQVAEAVEKMCRSVSRGRSDEIAVLERLEEEVGRT